MQITVSIPNRPTLTAEVDFPPRSGEMVVVGHDYYRVDSVCWTWDVEAGMRVRMVVVDMYESKPWVGWGYVVLYALAALGLTMLIMRCVAG